MKKPSRIGWVFFVSSLVTVAATAIAATAATATAVATTATATAASSTAAATTVAAAATTATAATTVATTTATCTTTVATAAAAATTTTTTATGSTTATFTWAGFVDRQGAAVELGVVHAIDGFLAAAAHFHEGEAAWATGVAVHDQLNFGHGSETREGFLQRVLGRRERHVADIQIH
jgi:hypothetical protein